MTKVQKAERALVRDAMKALENWSIVVSGEQDPRILQVIMLGLGRVFLYRAMDIRDAKAARKARKK